MKITHEAEQIGDTIICKHEIERVNRETKLPTKFLAGYLYVVAKLLVLMIKENTDAALPKQ